MSGITENELSPWSSGTWRFNPKEVSLASPYCSGAVTSRKSAARGDVPSGQEPRMVRPTRFGLFPEQELIRVAYISLFAFSGILLAILVMLLFP
ncbi:hypothetical protein MRY87_01260 [bacterium]|nr:hypothetical protein [bacterium]